jgi:starvation-inducible outer membrane lipoprotein
LRKEKNTIKLKKNNKKKEKMIKKILILLTAIAFTSCATINDKMPKRKACTGENKTLADIICKK